MEIFLIVFRYLDKRRKNWTGGAKPLNWSHEPQSHYHDWRRRGRGQPETRPDRGALPAGKSGPCAGEGLGAQGNCSQSGYWADLQDKLRQGEPHQWGGKAWRRAPSLAANLR